MKKHKGGVKITNKNLPQIKLQKIDCHMHSKFSDGEKTPAELIRLGLKYGVGIGALTDHDTIAGIPQAILAALKYNFKFFEGIEVTSLYKGMEIHILGLGIDHTIPVIRRYSDQIQFAYKDRAGEMSDKIEGDPRYNWKIDRTLLDKPYGIVSRSDIARAVQNRGMSSSEFFEKFLAEGCRYCVQIEKVSVKEAFEMIDASGGKAFWAHPGFSLRNNRHGYSMRRLAEEFTAYGLKGIEVFYKKHTKDETVNALAIAEELGIIPGVGSDFHRLSESVPGQCDAFELRICPNEIVRRIEE